MISQNIIYKFFISLHFFKYIIRDEAFVKKEMKKKLED